MTFHSYSSLCNTLSIIVQLYKTIKINLGNIVGAACACMQIQFTFL